MDVVDVSDPKRVVVDFDHHSSELPERHTEIFDEFRAKCPVAYSAAHGGFWVLSGYQEVAEVARDDERFSSAHDVDGSGNGYGGIIIPPMPFNFGFIEEDPPRTTAVRRVLNPYFAPWRVEGLKPLIRDVTTACIDRVIEKGSCDFIEDIASPVPSILTLSLLGMPVSLWKLFADANHHLNTSVDGPPREQAVAEMNEMVGHIGEAIRDRLERDSTGEDWLSVLCRAEVEGQRLSFDELLANALLLVAGGVDTTTSLLGSTVAWLDKHRADRDRLAQNPSLLPIATEEFLRVFAPVTGLSRTCTRRTELNGQVLEAGEPVMISWLAANMDPAVFDTPHEVRLDRWPNRHTSFGLGLHRCIGSNFARAQAHIVLEQVLTRFPDLAVDHEAATKYPSFGVNQGWNNLPITFTPGPKLGHTIEI